jgi:hypothetical protein
MVIEIIFKILFFFTVILNFTSNLTYASTFIKFDVMKTYQRIDAQNLNNQLKVNILSDPITSYAGEIQFGSTRSAWSLSFANTKYLFKNDPNFPVSSIENLNGNLQSYQIARWWRPFYSMGLEFKLAIIYEDYLIVNYPNLIFRFEKKASPGALISLKLPLWRFSNPKNESESTQEAVSGLFIRAEFIHFYSEKSSVGPKSYYKQKYQIEYSQKLASSLELHAYAWNSFNQFETTIYRQKNKEIGFGVSLVILPKTIPIWVFASRKYLW